MVTNSRERCTKSFPFCNPARTRLFLASSACSRIVSISLYSSKSLRAVFGPTPSTPGILSEVSPTNANISIIPSGPTPHFSFTLALS